MTNQIQPSHAQEEQPEQFYCRHCHSPVVRGLQGFWGQNCNHEPERRLYKNAQKRREVEEYLQEARNE